MSLEVGGKFSQFDDPFVFMALTNPDQHPTAPIVAVKTPWHDAEGTMTRQLTRRECEQLRDFLTERLAEKQS